jgi:hypothetical protein
MHSCQDDDYLYCSRLIYYLNSREIDGYYHLHDEIDDINSISHYHRHAPLDDTWPFSLRFSFQPSDRYEVTENSQAKDTYYRAYNEYITKS